MASVVVDDHHGYMQGQTFQLSGDEREELARYQKLSTLAVVSLLLAILSVAALYLPAAWVLPLPAVICSLIALRRIANNPDVLFGRRVALFALAVSLFFGFCAPMRYASAQWILSRQARDFAEQWFQHVINGDLEIAHQGTLDYYRRQPEGTLLQEFYRNSPEDLRDLNEYFNEGAPKDLLTLGRNVRLEYQRDVAYIFGSLVSQRYNVFRAGGAQPDLQLQVAVARDVVDDRVYWTLVELANIGSPEQPH